jgi:hypothetical protein
LNSNRFVDLEPGPPITLPSIERRWQLDSPSPHPPAIEDELVARIGEELARDVSVEIRSIPRHDDEEGGGHSRRG